MKKKTIKGLIIFVSVVAILCVTAVFVIPQLIDLNHYKPLIEKKVEDATGRKLTINGDIHLTIGLQPTIAVSDVTLSNPSWASTPNAASIKTLFVQFSLLSLLQGHLEIHKLTMDGADINVESHGKQGSNWQFTTDDTSTKKVTAPKESKKKAEQRSRRKVSTDRGIKINKTIRRAKSFT